MRTFSTWHGLTLSIAVCLTACGVPPAGPVCGNGVCETGETMACTDCLQGPTCGNGVCEVGETAATCAGDCGGGGPVCGNSVCEAGETPANCAGDCPCSDHNQCAGGELCIATTCVSAYPRTYIFTVVDANLPGVDPSTGSAWDSLGGAPDPFVELCDTMTCPIASTVAVADTFTPVWNFSFPITLVGPAGDLWFDMWDEDISTHDFALETTLGSPADWVNVVRNMGGVYLYTASPGLDLMITVQPM